MSRRMPKQAAQHPRIDKLHHGSPDGAVGSVRCLAEV